MHNRWHPDIAPVVTVAAGETLTLEAEDGLAGQLTRESTHADCATLDLGLGHPLAGPVEIIGAKPDDVLEVEFLEYRSADFGVTAVIPGFGFLADRFTDPFLVKWEIDDDVARSGELPGVAVPADTFAGVVGVAPSRGRLEELRRREERIRERGGPVADPAPETARPRSAAGGLRTIPPREIGGNLDIRQLVEGSRLYLPVDVPGALFSIGDLHFAQGDRRGLWNWDRGRRGGHGGTPPPRGPLPSKPFSVVRGPGATRAALVRDDGDSRGRRDGSHRRSSRGAGRDDRPPRGDTRVPGPAAYALCSAVVDLRLSEVVDVPYPVVSALLPLDIFE